MIDMHSHCLPGIDDGARNTSDALLMLCDAKVGGTKTVVATPHIRPYSTDDIKVALDKRERALALLKTEDCGSLPEILLGFEVYLGAEITQFENFSDMCIEGTCLMLTELPFGVWDNFALRRVELLTKAGITPIIAHLERYIGIKGNVEKILSLDDVIIQINADAFLHVKTRHFAERVIKSGRRVVIGSDMHDPVVRKSKMEEAYNKVKNKGPLFLNAFNAEKLIK